MFLFLPQGFQLLTEGCFLVLASAVKQPSADDIVSQKQDDRADHTDDQPLGGLHKHGHITYAAKALFINTHQLVGRHESLIGHIVGIALGFPGESAVLIGGHLSDAVGHDAGAVSLRVKKSNDISSLDILRICRMTKDKIAGLNFWIHGVCQDDQRERPADARHIIAPGKALEDEGAIYNQNRDQDDAENYACDRPDPVHD